MRCIRSISNTSLGYIIMPILLELFLLEIPSTYNKVALVKSMFLVFSCSYLFVHAFYKFLQEQCIEPTVMKVGKILSHAGIRLCILNVVVVKWVKRTYGIKTIRVSNKNNALVCRYCMYITY